MKKIAVALVVSCLLFMFTGVGVAQDQNTGNAGSAELREHERDGIGWPAYGGAVLFVVGFVFVLMRNRRRRSA